MSNVILKLNTNSVRKIMMAILNLELKVINPLITPPNHKTQNYLEINTEYYYLKKFIWFI